MKQCHRISVHYQIKYYKIICLFQSRQSNPKFINVDAIKSNNQDKLLSHKADCRPSRLSPKCLQTLDALVFGTTLFFWIGGIVSVEEINMNWYNSILSQHYLNNKTFTFYLCPLIMNYRVPKKLLLLVVVFKLHHHISGAMSNATQIIRICGIF